MVGAWTSALIALFLIAQVHPAIAYLVQSACDAEVGDLQPEGIDPDGDPADPNDDGSDEEPPPSPTSSQLDEDDVKHCTTFAWCLPVGSDARVAALEREELAHHHHHVDDLERPPRA